MTVVGAGATVGMVVGVGVGCSATTVGVGVGSGVAVVVGVATGVDCAAGTTAGVVVGTCSISSIVFHGRRRRHDCGHRLSAFGDHELGLAYVLPQGVAWYWVSGKVVQRPAVESDLGIPVLAGDTPQ